jgi:hypothetical protein
VGVPGGDEEERDVAEVTQQGECTGLNGIAKDWEDGMTIYIGDRTIDGISVLADGKPLSPYYEVLRLTEYGFEWSYEGPPPAQLAFALLYDYSRDAALARSLYQPFMEQVVANFDNEWQMTSEDVAAAVEGLREHRAA